MLVPCAHAWIAGSTNSPTPCSIRITSRAFWNASATLPSVAPAHEPVEPVRAAEQQDLPEQVGPALREDACGEPVGERLHAR